VRAIPAHNCSDAFCDNCRGAAARAYRESRELGTDGPYVFNFAVTMLALRHPGRKRQVYVAAVADWLDEVGDAEGH
jgi:hypothetical protein